MSIKRYLRWQYAVILFFSYLGWVYITETESFTQNVGINLIQLSAGLFVGYLLFRHARLQKARTWNQWFFYALGITCYAIAQLYWTGYYFYYHSEPETMGIPEIFWIGQYIFYIIALRFHIKNNKKSYPLLRYYLDILIFTVCSISLYWHYFFELKLTEPIHHNAVLMLDFLCSSMNAGIFFGLVVLFAFERSEEPVTTLLPLVLGFGLKGVSNTIHLHIYLSESATWLALQLPDFLLFIGILLVGIVPLMGDTPIKDRSNHLYARQNFPYKRMIPFVIITLMIAAMFLGIREPSAMVLGTSLTIVLLLFRLWLSMIGFKSAEKALLEAERKYRTLVENSQVGVFSAQYGQLTYVNRYFANTFGYKPEEMLGSPFLHYFAGEDRQMLAVKIAKLAVKNEFTPHIGITGITQDGKEVHLEVQVTRTMNQGDPAITGTLLDITGRKLAEEMVIRSEKLSVVGQLAAGVAHEIRNPLTSLKGFTQLLKARSEFGDTTRNYTEYYDIMLTELDRINYIVGEFMLLSKPQQLQRLELHDLEMILRDMLPIIETQAILHNVMITVVRKSELSLVRCDQYQIKQVFINLLKNAIESMSAGGSVRIEFSSEQKHKVRICIIDNGPGMPPEMLSRLGEPFFSTKSTGTGLGLMVCYRIIEAHNGTMQITSEPNVGTTVHILL